MASSHSCSSEGRSKVARQKRSRRIWSGHSRDTAERGTRSEEVRAHYCAVGLKKNFLVPRSAFALGTSSARSSTLLSPHEAISRGRVEMERNFNDTFGAGSTPNVGGSSGQSGSPGAGSAGFGSGAERADTSFSGAP